MLSSITHNRQEDQPNKDIADIGDLSQRVDRVNHELGTDSHQRSGEHKRQHGHPDRELRLLGLIVRILHLHLLRVLAAHRVRAHAANLCQSAAGVALADALAPLLDLQTGLVVHRRVGLELEEEVAAVDDKEEDTRAAGERDGILYPSWTYCQRMGIFFLFSCFFSGLLTFRPLVERSGNDQATDCQGEETGRCLGNDDVEVLLHAVDTAEEEAHAQDKQQVGQNTADQRGLHNDDLVLDQGDDGDDQFDGVTE